MGPALPVCLSFRRMSCSVSSVLLVLCICLRPTTANWALNQQQHALDLENVNKEGIGEFMSLSSMTFPETSERALHIVAAETRNVSATLLGKSVKKDRLEQVGYGRKWEGFKTKVLLLLEYLNALAEKNPNDIVAFVDSDVIYAPTCQPSHILKEYDLIKKKTGAKIIFGAEVNRFETDRVDDIPYVPKWASDYKPQLVDGSFREYVRPGYNEAGLVYLNSGGFIGPTKMLKEMVEEASAQMEAFLNSGEPLNEYKRTHFRPPGDQHFYWEYFLNHRDIVTIDYYGGIFQCVAVMKVLDMFTIRNGALYNKWLEQKVCLSHFNGGAKFKFSEKVLHMINEAEKQAQQ